MIRSLVDTDLALLATHISRDVSHVVGCYLRHRCHIAEFPVMGTDAILRGELESGIGMMRGLVDAVQERRPLVRTFQGRTMAGSLRLEVSSASFGIRHSTVGPLSEPFKSAP